MSEPLLDHAEPSSFRDPAARLYERKGVLTRQIYASGIDDYAHLIASGLYKELTESQLLIPHEELTQTISGKDDIHKIIQPHTIFFISYPFEWCFSQLKDAALLTLKITQLALAHDMILKDASAYNVQFHQGKPIFIDTTSFARYNTDSPWQAYHQFCKHFLSPLLLMARKDERLLSFFYNNLDGIPLDLTSKLLPLRTYFSPSIFAHIHLHAKSEKTFSATGTKKKKVPKVSKIGLLGLLDNLTQLIKKTKWKYSRSEWSHYYDNTNYSENAYQHKEKVVSDVIRQIQPNAVWDLGANTGHYSRLLTKKNIPVVSFDIDPIACEINYQKAKNNSDKYMLPIRQDFTNPSAAIGFANLERRALHQRGSPDLIMALALIHHLAISHNIPLTLIAKYFSHLGTHLLIEFVPKEDSQVQRLLSSRLDIFDNYDQKGFQHAFSAYYDILECTPVEKTHRNIFLMRTKKG